MKQLEPTLTLQLDDKTFEIAKMSPRIQQLIEYYDDWRQREVEITSDLNMVKMAQQALQTQIVQAVQEELKTAEQPSASPEVTDAVAKPVRRGRNSRK